MTKVAFPFASVLLSATVPLGSYHGQPARCDRQMLEKLPYESDGKFRGRRDGETMGISLMNSEHHDSLIP